MILCKQLSLQKHKRVLLDVLDLHVPRGSFALLLGLNGAGKTTLLRCLLGVENAYQGEVYVDGQNLTKLSRLERASLIAWVPAESSLPFSISAYDFVLLGRFPQHQGLPSAEDHRHVERVLAAMGMLRLAERPFPKLSSGERKLLEIARALAQDTPLILLDEPCSHLDINSELKSLELLRHLSKIQGKTVLMSSHRFSLAKRFVDYAVLMHPGVIYNAGKASDLLQPKSLARIFPVPERFLN